MEEGRVGEKDTKGTLASEVEADADGKEDLSQSTTRGERGKRTKKG
jgi:hypothetical protein